MDRRAAVYRFFDREGSLLYAGCSHNPFARFSLHIQERPNLSEVARVEITWFERRADAMKAESIAIASENPRWNKYQSVAPLRDPNVVGPGPGLMREWLDGMGRLAKAQIIRLGVSDGGRGDLVNGRRPPCEELAARIAAASDGLIPVSAWSVREGFSGKPVRCAALEDCADHEASLCAFAWWSETFAGLPPLAVPA